MGDHPEPTGLSRPSSGGENEHSSLRALSRGLHQGFLQFKGGRSVPGDYLGLRVGAFQLGE